MRSPRGRALGAGDDEGDGADEGSEDRGEGGGDQVTCDRRGSDDGVEQRGDWEWDGEGNRADLLEDVPMQQEAYINQPAEEPRAVPAALPTQAQDGPIVARRTSAYFRKGQEYFVYPPGHDLISFDEFDLGLSVAWSPQEITSLRQSATAPSGPAWDEISKGALRSKKTAFQCFSMFHNNASVSLAPWTAEEERRLVHLAGKYHEHYWFHVAAELGTNRSPVECLKHYQQALNPKLVACGAWNPEEEALLRDLVAAHGTAQWHLVATHMPGRTAEQCVDRWKRSGGLREDITLGAWEERDERSLFLAGIALDLPLSSQTHAVEDSVRTDCVNDQVGSRVAWARPRGGVLWTSVARLVSGKSEMQCREKWTNVLDPSLRSEPYSADEEALLAQLVDRFGEGKWAKIAAHLPGRTDASVRKQWMSRRGATEVHRAPTDRPLPATFHKKRRKAVLTSEDFVMTKTLNWSDHKCD